MADTLAPNYFASTLETISGDDQLGLIDPRIHLTAAKPNEKDGPDLHNIFVKVRPCPEAGCALNVHVITLRMFPLYVAAHALLRV